MPLTVEQHRHEALKHGLYATALWGALVAELFIEGAVDAVSAVIFPLLAVEVPAEVAVDFFTFAIAAVETGRALYHSNRSRRLSSRPQTFSRR